MEYKQRLIDLMVESGVLRFGSFVTKSGRQSPYFINTGFYMTGKHIAELGEIYADFLRENVDLKDAVLYGPAYKGIPIVIAAASALYRKHGLDLPYLFNRKEAKDHGEGGLFVGHVPEKDERIVILEDVMTSGKALRESEEFLKTLPDARVSDLVISVDRRERGTGTAAAIDEVSREFGIRISSIVTIYDIVDALYNRERNGKVYIDDRRLAEIRAYLEKYGADRT